MKLTIFYDGACHLCFREVKHYLKLDKKNVLVPVDISSDSFHAKDYGLDEKEVNLHMHSINEEGQVFKGIDTFIEIWKRVPFYHYLVPAFENEKLRPLVNLGYNIFAKEIRPRLPKRKCANGVCALNEN